MWKYVIFKKMFPLDLKLWYNAKMSLKERGIYMLNTIVNYISGIINVKNEYMYLTILTLLAYITLKFLAFLSHPSHTYAVVWFQGDSFALFVDRWCFSKTFGDSKLGGVIKSSQVLVAQLCPTLCDRMDCSPPGSSVRGILQARILEWVAIPFSRAGIFPTQGLNPGLLHCRQII